LRARREELVEVRAEVGERFVLQAHLNFERSACRWQSLQRGGLLSLAGTTGLAHW
jgi:hypothetical protein